MPGSAWIWPTGNTVLSGYHYTDSHKALDIGLREGDKVFSPTKGTVTFAGWSTAGYGNLVIIQDGNGDKIYLAHLSEIDTKVGQTVKPGQTIGLGGTTGNSTGPHLHFEVRTAGGSAVNPYSFYGTENPTPGKEYYAATNSGQSFVPHGSMGQVPGAGATGSTAALQSSVDQQVAAAEQSLTAGILAPIVDFLKSLPWADIGSVLLGLVVIALGVYGLVILVGKPVGFTPPLPGA